MKRFAILIVFLLSLFPSLADAQWGDLTVTFRYEGEAPKPDRLVVTKAKNVCGKHKLYDESLIVHEEDGGIANVVVFLLAKPNAAPPVHPDYQKKAKIPVELDNSKCRFEPHVVTVRTGQPVVLKNSDPIGHNTAVSTFTNPGINPLIPAGSKLQTKFTEVERLPMPVSCSIHPWMKAWILIQDHPYMGVTDSHGKLTLKKVPAGTWEFQICHERPGFIQKVNVDGKETRWRRGRIDVVIKPGETTDLGTIGIPAAVFEQ